MKMPSQEPFHISPLAHLTFLMIATAGLTALAWYLGRGGFPQLLALSTDEMFRPWPAWMRTAFNLWFVLGAIVGLVLPILALLRWGRYSAVRWALFPYAFILVIQIVTEGVLASTLSPRIAPLVGVPYTAYRIWHLVRERQVFRVTDEPKGDGRTAVDGILSISIIFWSVNAAVLIAILIGRTWNG